MVPSFQKRRLNGSKKEEEETQMMGRPTSFIKLPINSYLINYNELFMN
jgi:hypothetical protein